MPTLLLLLGGRGRASTLHVAKGDAAAKIWLRPVRVEYASGFNPAEKRRLREITVEHEADFLERWNEYFSR